MHWKSEPLGGCPADDCASNQILKPVRTISNAHERSTQLFAKRRAKRKKERLEIRNSISNNA
jgi:hypothetical protein